MITHPELDGPISVPTGYAPQVVNGVTVQVQTGFVDNRWNTTPRFRATNSAALAPYVVGPSPLARVWAGDDPANPIQTVALAFPDAATAATVLLACGAIDTSTAQQ